MPDKNDKLLTGAQAAEFLGVKSATLYAYASRGLIESIPSRSGRERSYRLSDLMQLRQSSRGFKRDKAPDAAVWMGPVIKSAITEIRNDGHRYRGHNAIELAMSDKPFEDVVEILWETAQVGQTAWKKVKPFAISKQMRALASSEVDYLDLLKLLLVVTELGDPLSRKLNAEDIFITARRLIVTISTTPGIENNRGTYYSDGAFPLAQTLLSALSPNKGRDRDRIRLVNCALVLCADHELNASALAARVAASCDASLYSCLLSAMGTFSGSLHGSASRRVEDLVTACAQFKTTKAWMKDHLRRYDRIPGFGMELYPHGDPRAKLLIKSAQRFAGKNGNLQRLLEIIECVRDQLGTAPNLDAGLAATSYALSLPPGSGSTIFAVSRAAGWIAHAIEQRQYGGVIRPRARYIGKA